MASEIQSDAGQRVEPEDSERIPVFRGADQLYRLIGALYQRTRFGDRPRQLVSTGTGMVWDNGVDRPDRAGRKGLPMVCLVRPDGPAQLLTAIDDMLTEAKRGGVPHAYVNFGDNTMPDDQRAEDDWEKAVPLIRSRLRQARNGLVKSRLVRGRRLRFPLFTLVDSLMTKRLADDDQDPDSTLRRHFSDHSGLRRIRAAVQTADRQISDQYGLWRLPLWAFYLLTFGLYRARLTGRVPLLSGRYRWFLRQPHLAPEMSGTFVRFAERLVDGEWQKEAPEYVARLLVNAFLEDLRRAYRLRPWHLRARRMTYPVLLLDNITMTNGGFSLLRLINAVRNQVGTFDPLLVVSASDTVPPDAGHRYKGRPQFDADQAATAYNAWQNQLLKDRRARRETAWYLSIRVSTELDETARQREIAALKALGELDPGWKAARPPLLTSRWLRLGVVALLLVTGAWSVWQYHNDHCGIWGWYGADIQLHSTGNECIGYTDGSHNPFSPVFDEVVDRIAQQNEQAEEKYQQDPDRPYITIVYLGALQDSGTDDDALSAERESLAGVAVAQHAALNADGKHDPIVRVVIANAGAGMAHGPEVAKALSDLAHRDNRVVGVVGLDASSKATADAVLELTKAGLPVVAAPLSQDDLAPRNPMYFQVAPDNLRQAQMVAQFAAEQATKGVADRKVTIYYSADPNDSYSSNLREDAVSAFADRGFTVQSYCYRPNGAGESVSVCPVDRATGQPAQFAGDPTSAGHNTCGSPGFVFFAGRGLPDFADFLRAVADCPGSERAKTVYLGGDDVSRYVANFAKYSTIRDVPFYYVSFAPSPETAEKTASTFYSNLTSLFQFEQSRDNNRSRDGHAAMSHDAAEVLINAAQGLQSTTPGIEPTPGTVWRQITALKFQGASGVISFDPRNTDEHQVPSNKAVTIMQAGQNDEQMIPTVAATCGDTGMAPGPTLAHCP